jgi:hypothetical protein
LLRSKPLELLPRLRRLLLPLLPLLLFLLLCLLESLLHNRNSKAVVRSTHLHEHCNLSQKKALWKLVCLPLFLLHHRIKNRLPLHLSHGMVTLLSFLVYVSPQSDLFLFLFTVSEILRLLGRARSQPEDSLPSQKRICLVPESPSLDSEAPMSQAAASHPLVSTLPSTFSPVQSQVSSHRGLLHPGVASRISASQPQKP